MKKEVKDYMQLPYTFLIQPITDESGDYFYGRILELDGCQSTGETFGETFQNLQEAMEGYLETKLAHGIEVPRPASVDERYSGKFNIRIPKTLHQKLVVEAQREGISLNQYVLYKLAQ